MSEQGVDGEESATDVESAFTVLSHELRLDILLALWEAEGYSLTFSELRKAVDERDSGRFNYHLSKLQDHFVVATDEGYELQYPGHRVLDAIQSGVFHEETTVEPFALEQDCRDCGAALAFEYGTDSIARVRCPDCGNRALEWPFDPGGVADRDPEGVVEAFDRRTRLIWTCALDGVCPFCAGRVSQEVASDATEGGACVGVIEGLDRYEEYFASDHPALVAIDCERCSFYSFLPVGVLLLTRPSVTGELHRAGVALRERPLWDLGFVVDAEALDVRSAAPLELEVTVEAPGDEDPLTAVVDDTLDVALKQGR